MTMPVVLALVEGSSILAAVCATLLVRTLPAAADWSTLPAVVARVLAQALALSGCCFAAFYYNDLYDLRAVPSMARFASRLPQAFGVAVILLVGLYALFPDAKMTEGPFVSSVLTIVGVVFSLRAVSYGVLRSGLLGERVLILGSSPLARKLIEEIDGRRQLPVSVLGVVEDAAAPGEPPPRCPVLGPLERLEAIVEARRPDRIIVALADWRGRLPVHELLRWRARGVLIEDCADAYERLTGKLAIEALTPSAVIFSRGFRRSWLGRAVNRTINLLVASGGLIGLAPLFVLIALAIKLDSPGPVFFVQDRVGRHGKPFKMIKFRTMHRAPSTRSEWVRDNGDRITRVGRWLRKFRLDELPQLANVLRGEMSLVGPRPHPVSNAALFTEKIPYYALRSMVRPGITGWAQVWYGYANGLEEETEKMRYDLYYIKHTSLWFDLRILFATVRVVLLGCGAEEADVSRLRPPRRHAVVAGLRRVA